MKSSNKWQFNLVKHLFVSYAIKIICVYILNQENNVTTLNMFLY